MKRRGGIPTRREQRQAEREAEVAFERQQAKRLKTLPRKTNDNKSDSRRKEPVQP